MSEETVKKKLTLEDIFEFEESEYDGDIYITVKPLFRKNNVSIFTELMRLSFAHFGGNKIVEEDIQLSTWNKEERVTLMTMNVESIEQRHGYSKIYIATKLPEQEITEQKYLLAENKKWINQKAKEKDIYRPKVKKKQALNTTSTI